ncbi:hypothetical protein KEJ49_07335, partial [Candidatus Bathyarchaeota archaeon]|nr:hypothetical protein [Candidatus Bathyarchaeota archaeon]
LCCNLKPSISPPLRGLLLRGSSPEAPHEAYPRLDLVLGASLEGISSLIDLISLILILFPS